MIKFRQGAKNQGKWIIFHDDVPKGIITKVIQGGYLVRLPEKQLGAKSFGAAKELARENMRDL